MYKMSSAHAYSVFDQYIHNPCQTQEEERYDPDETSDVRALEPAVGFDTMLRLRRSPVQKNTNHVGELKESSEKIHRYPVGRLSVDI